MRRPVLVIVTVLAALGAVLPVAQAAPPRGHHRHPGPRLYWSQFVDENFSTLRLVRLNLRNGRVHALTYPGKNVQDIDARVSPNGRWVLFERDDPSGSFGAYVVRSTGGPVRKLSLPCSGTCVGVSSPTWTRDGRHVVFTRVVGPFDQPNESARSAVLWRTDLHGRHLRRLSQPGIDGTFEDYHATFAPAGYVVFVRVRNSDIHSAAFRMDRHGHHVRRLTPWSIDADTLSVSPARRGPSRDLVVFETYGHDFTGHTSAVGTVSAKHPVDRQGRPLLRFLTSTSSAPVHNFNPTWSPSGRRIAFTRFTEGSPSSPPLADIWWMRWNGAHKKQLSSSPLFDFRPAWGRRAAH